MARLKIHPSGNEVDFIFFAADSKLGRTIATSIPGYNRGSRFIVFNDPGMSFYGFVIRTEVIDAKDSTFARIRKADPKAILKWFPFLPQDTEIIFE